EAVEEETSDGNAGGVGRVIYKHLMNGVSHMLPFVVGGGVLIAVSFLFGIHSAEPDHVSYNHFADLLNLSGGVAFGLMVPVLAAFIAQSIAQRPGLVAGFVGGMIADTGGSGFLGGIVAGFIAGYIILLLMKVFEGLPKTLDGLKAIFIYPLLGIFLTGAAMYIIVGSMTTINEGMMNFLSNFQGSNPIL